MGICGARWAQDGRVVAANYGKVTGFAQDPIEKKPLARFYPGSSILSVGSYGCNMRCAFCQNSDISQPEDLLSLEVRSTSPEELVEVALATRSRGNIGIAYTYNEPLVGYEFVMDTARLAHKAGLLNVIVSNGYINEGPLVELLPFIDAANIDLKAFNQYFYDQVGAPRGLETVKRSIEVAAAFTHLEVTTLVIPGLNDGEDEMDSLAAWLAGIDPQIPLHITRFYPAYRMRDVSATPRHTIHSLVSIARSHMAHVYAGNM